MQANAWSGDTLQVIFGVRHYHAPTVTMPSRGRVSLTRLQRESAAGLELLAICQQVTSDGRLAVEELDDLQGWLMKYADAPLAGRAYLDATLQRVMADGVVSPEELKEVHAALEKILPPDVRADVVGRRKAHEAAERSRNEPIDGWDFMVAGCRYEGRPYVIASRCRAGDRLFLVRDPANAYSRNAIEVRLASGDQIGFVPEADARDMARLLDEGQRYHAELKKILTGGRAPIPVVIADFYDADATVAGLTLPGAAPPKPPRTAGCLAGLALAVVLTALIWMIVA